MRDLDVRLIRRFVAVADELHFGRAASVLHVAQQAVSRDIARLEDVLGVRLFDRSTRHVRLTADARRLLPEAREMLAANDRLVVAAAGTFPLLVDVVGEGHTPWRLLQLVRQDHPEAAVVARFGGGLTGALPALTQGNIHVAFGRVGGLPFPLPATAVHDLVRLEPLAVLIQDHDPLASLERVPLAALSDRSVDVSLGNPAAREWSEFGVRLFHEHGIAVTEPHEPSIGAEETAHHLRTHDTILTFVDGPAVPGAVRRQLVEPVVLYPWSLVHIDGLDHPGFGALRNAIAQLSTREGWMAIPPGAWIDPADALLHDLKAG